MTAAALSFAGFALVLALTAQVVLEVMHLQILRLYKVVHCARLC